MLSPLSRPLFPSLSPSIYSRLLPCYWLQLLSSMQTQFPLFSWGQIFPPA